MKVFFSCPTPLWCLPLINKTWNRDSETESFTTAFTFDHSITQSKKLRHKNMWEWKPTLSSKRPYFCFERWEGKLRGEITVIPTGKKHFWRAFKYPQIFRLFELKSLLAVKVLLFFSFSKLLSLMPPFQTHIAWFFLWKWNAIMFGPLLQSERFHYHSTALTGVTDQ